MLEHPRTIGFLQGSDSGPLLIALAGLHGNEKAGLNALNEIFKRLEKYGGIDRGAFIGLRGNLKALQKGVRYLKEDMNRIWLPSIIDKIRRTPPQQLKSPERREIKELLELINRVSRRFEGQKIIVADLHSFSAEGSPFLITADKEDHIDLCAPLHVPMVFGIEATLQGAALRYLQDTNCISFALEGGQHDHPQTAFNLIASLFVLLVSAGYLDSEVIPNYPMYLEHLEEQNRSLPGKAELVYQHIIEPADGFRMRPGYHNFQPVEKGEWVAEDNSGPIHAQTDGYMLMPLYQEQGNDGFFIVRQQDS